MNGWLINILSVVYIPILVLKVAVKAVIEVVGCGGPG